MVSCLTLITSPMITFSFVGPTLQTHVEGASLYLNSSGVSMHGLLQFDCGVPCEQRGGRAHLERPRRGCDRSALHFGTWFDVLAAGPSDVCVLRATGTIVLCVLMVGNITVLVETLTTKLGVRAYHGQWVLNVAKQMRPVS